MRRFLRAGQLDPRPVITHRFPLGSDRRGHSGHQGRPGRQGDPGDRRMSIPARCPARGASSTQFQPRRRLQAPQLPRQARRARESGWRAGARSSSCPPTTISASATSPRWSQPGKAALDRYGAGTASVRFICGTFTVHRELEAACARLVGTAALAQLRELLERQRGRSRHRCSARRTSSSATSSITPRSSTACGSPRRSPSARPAVYQHADLTDLDAEARRGHGPPHPDGDHRRRLLDGRRDRPAARPRRALPAPRRRPGRGRLPRDRRAGRRPGGAPPSTSAWWVRSTSSPPPWARRWAARPAASWPARRRSATT